MATLILLAWFRAYLVLGIGLAVGLGDNGESHLLSSSPRSEPSVSAVDFVRLDLDYRIEETFASSDNFVAPKVQTAIRVEGTDQDEERDADTCRHNPKLPVMFVSRH